jgi:hypothetical protein
VSPCRCSSTYFFEPLSRTERSGAISFRRSLLYVLALGDGNLNAPRRLLRRLRLLIFGRRVERSVSTPSHRLKLYRSDKHLEEMQALIAPLRGRREYPVVESMKRKGKNSAWSYGLDLSGIRPPEDFPIILGDYLFDIRSALDHLVATIAPKKYRGTVEFPIWTEDPLARDKDRRGYLNAEEARRWHRVVRGLPDSCVTALRVLQPYEAARLTGKPARDHPLAILKVLQNADKHRELVVVVIGLTKAEMTVNGEAEGIVPMLKDGAELVRTPAQMAVKLEGAAAVGVQRGKVIYGLGDFVDRLSTFVVDEVLSRLEPFLK